MALSTADELLTSLLPEWQLLLQGWSADGSLVAAAQEALMLSGEPAELRDLVTQWSSRDFSSIPPIVLLSSADMNGAMGAYAISTGTIYLNADWLVGATQEEVNAVLTEELGHHLDAQLNAVDTPGDEGEYFADLLNGQAPSDAEKAALATQDDLGSAVANSTTIPVENATVSDVTSEENAYPWNGTNEDDMLIWANGGDFINGLDGFDTLTTSSSRSQAQFYKSSDGINWVTINGYNLTLVNIERVQFSDGYTDITQPAFNSVSGGTNTTTDQADQIFWSSYYPQQSFDGKGGQDTLNLNYKKSDLTFTTNQAGVTYIGLYGIYYLGAANIEKVAFLDGELPLTPDPAANIVSDNYVYIDGNPRSGTSSNDVILWNNGSDIIDGKEGLDVLSTYCSLADATFYKSADGVNFATIGGDAFAYGAKFTVSLLNIEGVAFRDGFISLSQPSLGSTVLYNWYSPNTTSADDQIFWADGFSEVITGRGGFDTLNLIYSSNEIRFEADSSGINYAYVNNTFRLALIGIEHVSYLDGSKDLVQPAPPSGNYVIPYSQDPQDNSASEGDDIFFWDFNQGSRYDGGGGNDSLCLPYNLRDVTANKDNTGEWIVTYDSYWNIYLKDIEKITLLDGVIKISETGTAPTDLSLSSSGILENCAAGTVIGTLAATDPDAGSTFTYALVTGDGTNNADNGLVEIDGDQVKIKTGAVIDYETNPVLNINVQVTDNGGLTFIKALTASVTNAQEGGSIGALTSNTYNALSFVEGVTLTAGAITDPDGVTGAVTYTWYNGATQVQSSTSNTYKVGDQSLGTYRVEATYQDGTGSTVTAVSVNRVVDKADNGNSVVTVTGSAVVGSTLTASVTADPDGNGSIAYQWQSSSNGTTWGDIANATSATYTLTSTELTKQVRVVVRTTDSQLYSATINGSPTATVTAPSDTTVPTITDISVQGNTVILTFSEKVQSTGTNASLFPVKVGGNARTVSSSSFDNSTQNKVTLTLGGSAPASSSSLQVSYGGTSVKDLTGNSLATFTNRSADSFFSGASVTSLYTDYTNLTLTGTAAINGTGNGKNNSITGNQANNTINGAGSADVLTGLGGADTFVYTTLANSLLGSPSGYTFDRITDFAIGQDKIDGPKTVGLAQFQRLGSVATLDQAGLQAVLTTTKFVANGAASFTFGSGATARTFVAMNDGVAGFDGTKDAVVEITGYSGLLTNLSIV